jgi:sulfate/thiosulfate transport system substrate-binding protein
VQKLYKNVPVMDSGARGSATTFIQRGMGDVLLSWENEAFLAIKEFGADKLEIIVPSVSILAEPSVAVIQKVAAAKGTTEVANAYLQYLYSDVGQDIIGRNFYRPRDARALARYRSHFVKVPTLVTIESFSGWPAAQARHFDDGGIFDKITAP